MVIGRVGLIAGAWICLGVVLPASANAQVRFITVYQGQAELQADKILATTLGEMIRVPQDLEYGEVIKVLMADERSEGIVARVTPYAFVAAEMEGAKLDVLATYRSRSTDSTIVNPFLVVRRSEFPNARAGGPTLAEVLEYLKKRSKAEPATFIYHNKWSTSSYFFPSLYFRAQRVFARGDRTSDSITTINVKPLEPDGPTTSSDLVRAVAGGTADVASVWNGTKVRFDKTAPDYDKYGSKVWFVPLSTNLPCDVLVATRNVNEAIKQGIRDKLKKLGPIEQKGGKTPWDVDTWVDWKDGDAEDARRALQDLRRQASATKMPVVVDVRDKQTSSTDPITRESNLEAVRLAFRLAGTEFVEKSEYFGYYTMSDIELDLEIIHDNAARITVRYLNFFVKDKVTMQDKEVTQPFDVSFRTPDDLTHHVGSFIHSRMHRIRPIWLYKDDEPTVLRDMEFETPAGEPIPFQEIEWNDPEHNDYSLKGSHEARLAKEYPRKLVLEGNFRRRNDTKLDFEPMGRQAFRVLLIRPTRERMLFQILTVAFVALLALAAAGLFWDVRRWRAGLTTGAGESTAASVPNSAFLSARRTGSASDIVERG